MRLNQLYGAAHTFEAVDNDGYIAASLFGHNFPLGRIW
jgi:hypothetical protein